MAVQSCPEMSFMVTGLLQQFCDLRVAHSGAIREERRILWSCSRAGKEVSNEDRIFEANAPSPDELKGLSPAAVQDKYPKWFGNFPCPYMNMNVYIWDTQFAPGYQRLLGKRVLFPHGLHATGMSIKRCQDDKPMKTAQNGPAAPLAAVGKATKSKIAAKSTGLTYQFQIMFKKFADSHHWLEHFPLICKFGERYTIYSPKDRQPCMDHGLSDGEGMEVVEWSPAVKAINEGKIDGRKLFLSIHRYGQTNCFVGASTEYGHLSLCTYRAARNMAFQGLSPERGQTQQLLEIDGAALVGTKIKAPFGLAPEVYVLSMDNVSATKGIGVVTSVLSDSLDDFATISELRKKPEFYKIDREWVCIDPIPVLTAPTYGELTAPRLVEKLKIQSQKDVNQLAEAKEIGYKEGFYSGVMLVSEFKAQSVRTSMIEQGLAFAYAEPEDPVIFSQCR
ncbi:hypothetical protein BDR04DRAFT_1127359 [Suillus decipiens]|nr:hypothetical protein BDR04DRAFT_1127359 [Suillus decipiens]